MDSSRFDTLVSRLAEPGSRRRALGLLGLSALVAGGLQAVPETEARRRKRRKNKNKNQTPPPVVPPVRTPNKQKRQVCTPSADLCAAGSTCGTPTEDHRCSSTIDEWIGDAANLCCVPPGGACTSCECCGDFYCKFEQGDTGTCQPQP